MSSRRSRPATLAAAAAIAFILAVWTFPLLWVLVTSLKSRPDIFTAPPTILFTPTLENYVVAFTTRSLLPNLADSMVIAGGVTLFTLLAGVPAGYAFARGQFAFKRPLSFVVLFMQMMPVLGLIVPFFLLFTWLRWMDTYAALILVNLSVTVPTAIWLMITYFQELPAELEEAAALDGATRWQTFLIVMLPQVRGGIAVTAVLTFTAVWNEFLFAIVLGGSKVRPVTPAMFSFLQYEESLWGPLMAFAVLAMAPVVVVSILAQRHIVRGLTFGAVK